MKDLRFLHKENKTEIPELKKKIVEIFRKKAKDFNAKYKNICEYKSAYDEFVKKSSSKKWKVFKDIFLEIVDLKCPICENGIDIHSDIDHYRPKSHYWWLAYDYTNYVINCKLCNISYKKALFPLFVNGEISFEAKHRVDFNNRNKIKDEKPLIFNPNLDNPTELFDIEFSLPTQGAGIVTIKPERTLEKKSYKYAKAKTTINIFNLNNDNKNLKKLYGKFRLVNMEDNFNDLIVLAKLKYKLDNELPDIKNFKKYKNQLKESNAKTAKNGLIKLIENENFKLSSNFI